MNKTLIAFVAACLWGCATAPSTTQDYSAFYDGQPQAVFGTELPTADATEALIRGDRARLKQQYDRALYFYIRALAHDSTSAAAFVRIGAIHEHRGNGALAIRAYHEALQRQPDHDAVKERLAILLLNAGQTEAARERLRDVVAGGAASWRAHNGLGVAADLAGEHERATEHFSAALELRPDSPQLLNNLGYSHYLAGDLERARDAFARALLVDGSHELALRNMALVEVRAGNDETALGLLSRVSSAAEAHNDVGYLLMLEGRHSTAQRYLLQAIELAPTYYALAHRNLARSRELAEETRRQIATAAIEPPADIQPSEPRAAAPAPRAPDLSGAYVDLTARAPEPPGAYAELAPGAADSSNSYMDEAPRKLATALFADETKPSPAPTPAPVAASRAPEPAPVAVRAPEPAPVEATDAQGASGTPESVPVTMATSEPAPEAPPGAAVRPDAAPQAVSAPRAAPARAAAAERAERTAETAEDSTQLYQKRWVQAPALNVREAASIDAQRLDQLRRGHVVRVLRRAGEWAYIRYWEYVDGRTLIRSGWVYSRFLTAESVRA